MFTNDKYCVNIYVEFDWIKCDNDNYDYASKVDFVFKDKFGNELFYMTLTTAMKLSK